MVGTRMQPRRHLRGEQEVDGGESSVGTSSAAKEHAREAEADERQAAPPEEEGGIVCEEDQLGAYEETIDVGSPHNQRYMEKRGGDEEEEEGDEELVVADEEEVITGDVLDEEHLASNVVAEEIIEEYIDDFDIPVGHEDDMMPVDEKGAKMESYYSRGIRGRPRYYYSSGAQNSSGVRVRAPLINETRYGQMRSARERRISPLYADRSVRPPQRLQATSSGPLKRQAGRPRLLPVAVARQPRRPNQYPSAYPPPITRSTEWREEQKRRIELLEIHDSLPPDKQHAFLKFLEETGDNVNLMRQDLRAFPVASAKYRRTSNGREPARMLPGGSVEVPVHLVAPGNDLLLSPQPGGGAKLMRLVPVERGGEGEEQSERGKRTGEREEDGGDGREHQQQRHRQKRRACEEESSEDTEELIEAEEMPELEIGKQRGAAEEIQWSHGDEALSDVDVENVEDGEEHKGDEIPVLQSEVRQRRGLFYVPELDGVFGRNERALVAPKIKGGLRLCECCNVYMRKSIYYHHQRTIKEHGSCSANTPRRFECGVPRCDERLPTIERLCMHMAAEHGMPTEVQEADFDNEEDFQIFLVNLESKGGNFRMSRGNKVGKHGIVRYYRCNRVNRNYQHNIDSEHGDESARAALGVKDEPEEEHEDGVHQVVDGTAAGNGVRSRRGVGRGGNPTKKPLVRTERICSAFYRKAELPDGRIAVRFCDYHLHDDVRVKLPDSVRERIVEMLQKRLPMPVIVEVIKAESEQHAPPGTEVERRIYRINEKDVRNVYCANMARRREAMTLAGDLAELPEGVLIGELNDMEQRFLSAFEKAEGKSVYCSQKGNRVTLARRQKRDALREKHATIGRFMKTERFVECSDAQLARMEELFDALSQMCNPDPPGVSFPLTQTRDGEDAGRVGGASSRLTARNAEEEIAAATASVADDNLMEEASEELEEEEEEMEPIEIMSAGGSLTAVHTERERSPKPSTEQQMAARRRRRKDLHVELQRVPKEETEEVTQNGEEEKPGEEGGGGKFVSPRGEKGQPRVAIRDELAPEKRRVAIRTSSGRLSKPKVLPGEE